MANPLAVFTDGEYEWWVWDDDRDAFMEMYRKQTRLASEELERWYRMPDDAEMRIWLNLGTGDIAEPDEETAVVVLGQASVWAEAFGKGFLCGSEW